MHWIPIVIFGIVGIILLLISLSHASSQLSDKNEALKALLSGLICLLFALAFFVVKYDEDRSRRRTQELEEAMSLAVEATDCKLLDTLDVETLQTGFLAKLNLRNPDGDARVLEVQISTETSPSSIVTPEVLAFCGAEDQK